MRLLSPQGIKEGGERREREREREMMMMMMEDEGRWLAIWAAARRREASERREGCANTPTGRGRERVSVRRSAPQTMNMLWSLPATHRHGNRSQRGAHWVRMAERGEEREEGSVYLRVGGWGGEKTQSLFPCLCVCLCDCSRRSIMCVCVWSLCVSGQLSDSVIFSNHLGEYKKDELLEAARWVPHSLFSSCFLCFVSFLSCLLLLLHVHLFFSVISRFLCLLLLFSFPLPSFPLVSFPLVYHLISSHFLFSLVSLFPILTPSLLFSYPPLPLFADPLMFSVSGPCFLILLSCFSSSPLPSELLWCSSFPVFSSLIFSPLFPLLESSSLLSPLLFICILFLCYNLFSFISLIISYPASSIPFLLMFLLTFPLFGFFPSICSSPCLFSFSFQFHPPMFLPTCIPLSLPVEDCLSLVLSFPPSHTHTHTHKHRFALISHTRQVFQIQRAQCTWARDAHFGEISWLQAVHVGSVCVCVCVCFASCMRKHLAFIWDVCGWLSAQCLNSPPPPLCLSYTQGSSWPSIAAPQCITGSVGCLSVNCEPSVPFSQLSHWRVHHQCHFVYSDLYLPIIFTLFSVVFGQITPTHGLRDIVVSGCWAAKYCTYLVCLACWPKQWADIIYIYKQKFCCCMKRTRLWNSWYFKFPHWMPELNGAFLITSKSF